MEENFKKDGGSWKKFKIADLFEVVGTKSLDEGKLQKEWQNAMGNFFR